MSDTKLNIQAAEPVTAHHILFCHEGDSVGVQTMTDGKGHPPKLYTSRPMTDEEVGRVVRLSVETLSAEWEQPHE